MRPWVDQVQAKPDASHADPGALIRRVVEAVLLMASVKTILEIAVEQVFADGKWLKSTRRPVALIG